MNETMNCEEMNIPLETGKSCKLTELVKGCDQLLLEEMAPVVRRQNLALDMGSVERIDAAGIAALISLYRIAHESGHGFTVSNLTAHVAEILALVGLDRILVSHNAKLRPPCDCRLAPSAA